MGCEEIRELLALYVGGETTENERIAVEAHVGVCAPCRAEAEGYREARSMLADLREGQAPPGTFEKMWRRVREEAVPARRRALRFDWLIRAAAVLVIGIAIGFVFSASTSNPPVQADRPAARVGGSDGAPGIHAIGTGPERPRAFYHPSMGGAAVPASAGGHYLPSVEAVLTSEDVDF